MCSRAATLASGAGCLAMAHCGWSWLGAGPRGQEGSMVRLEVREPAFFGMVAALFTIFTTAPLYGQTLKGTILGTLTDATHAVVPNAQANLTETNTNFHRTEATNDSGFYAYANLDPGTYRIEVEHPRFRRTIRAGIDLLPNTTIRVDLDLSPGQVTEVIDVTADAPLLTTDRSDTGGKIENVQLQTLPTQWNRNYQGL